MKKINQRIAARSRLARINRQLVEGDERDEFENVVCGQIRPLTRFIAIHASSPQLGHRVYNHEIELGR